MKDHDMMMTVRRFRVFTSWVRPGLDLPVGLGMLIFLLFASVFLPPTEASDQPEPPISIVTERFN